MRYSPRLHHRRSVRLTTYDYTQAGAYFITICTHERECIFNDLRIDNLLRRIWGRTAGRGHYPREGDFVVMPNHIHGIVWIRAKHATSGATGVGASRPRIQGDASPADGASSTDVGLPLVDGSPLRSDLAPAPRRAESGSLGALIGSFKTNAAVAINNIRRAPGAPVWQRNYHEHVIRNEDDLRRIREYLLDNPRKWSEDPDNPTNIGRRMP
ncbi:MAG TPA: transposase [Dehalococcoidia bacterium]|nr:transposase [Dehalococcoidia bacterium]